MIYMRYFVFFLLINLISTLGISQVRNGWRSVYDKEGRLSRMNYYDNGKLVSDSNLFYQYYTENTPKVFVKGELDSKIGCINGSVSLFDPTGMLTSYVIQRGGKKVYDVNCDYYGNCSSVWIDLFESESGQWSCDSVSVLNSELIVHNIKSMGVALFDPEMPIDLSQPFSCKLVIPVEGNNASQGLSIGWKDESNYYLFETMLGKYYAIYQIKNGISTPLTDGRQPIDRPGEDYNEMVLKRSGQNLTFEINGSIQNVLKIDEFEGDKIALVTRAPGNAHFSDWIIKYSLPEDDLFFNQHWIGKGTGFFISKTGRILTTYEIVMDAKRVRVKGKINNREFTLPATIIRVDEENNLAVLQVDDPDFKPFETLPFGYADNAPASESKVYCIGYPNAISSVYMTPEVFEGNILSGNSLSSSNSVLALDFRNGMIGAPVFDFDFNFLGICSSKGLELKYSEMIDFYRNSRLYIAYMARTERKIQSPLFGKSYQEKYKVGTELVVIVETNTFGETQTGLDF